MGTKAAASSSFFLCITNPSAVDRVRRRDGRHCDPVIVVGIVAVQFLKCTVDSFIGSYWQAVSQMIWKESRPILEQADRMSDAEVKSWAKHQSLDLKGWRILRCQDDGRVALGVTEDEG
jgi:hypothetical protein